jgi:aldoxime dehydratase
MIVQFPRKFPIRKPEGFVPAVQRWSVAFPEKSSALHIGFFAVQAKDESSIVASGFSDWSSRALHGPFRPITTDISKYLDADGYINYVVAAYWVVSSEFDAWKQDQARNGWWDDEARLSGPCGFWREMVTVPVERFESIYWEDYPAALSKALPIEPTPYCGYFGAMRDRIPVAACDPLISTDPEALASSTGPRETFGKRWMIHPPHNLAMIRSASFWGRCDEEQKADYDTKLRDPLNKGMDYLRQNAETTGCCTLRFQQTLDSNGAFMPETHAHGYFISLSKMEDWSENHASHTAIFGAAIARYKKYGATNQLRTWHEVGVLPGHGQHFEYLNCHPQTGLLNWFEGFSV